MNAAGATQTTSRAERSRLTAQLIADAHDTDDAQERERLLGEVIVLNRPVAEAIAARYRGRGISEEDLTQCAYVGLIKAVRKFDPRERPELLTYAVPTIRGEVQRHFRDHGWTVRPPRRIQELQWHINRGLDALAQVLGRDPSPEELSSHLGCTRQELDQATAAFGAFSPAPLDRPVSGDTALTIGDTLAVTDDAEIGRLEAIELLTPVLPRLSDRDRAVIRMRFWDGLTQTEIGKELGISQMQVSRVQARILRDLRELIGG